MTWQPNEELVAQPEAGVVIAIHVDWPDWQLGPFRELIPQQGYDDLNGDVLPFYEVTKPTRVRRAGSNGLARASAVPAGTCARLARKCRSEAGASPASGYLRPPEPGRRRRQRRRPRSLTWAFQVDADCGLSRPCLRTHDAGLVSPVLVSPSGGRTEFGWPTAPTPPAVVRWGAALRDRSSSGTRRSPAPGGPHSRGRAR